MCQLSLLGQRLHRPTNPIQRQFSSNSSNTWHANEDVGTQTDIEADLELDATTKKAVRKNYRHMACQKSFFCVGEIIY